jgi:predicted nucleic acid-binding protein
MILLDTNLLGRMTDSTDPQCAVARRAVHGLLAKRERLVIVPQNLCELWAVATRKAGTPQNGLGMTCEQASQWLRFFRRRFTLLPDRPELLDEWEILVVTHKISGLNCYDARLVAAMHTYGVQQLLTFNAQDFKPFQVAILDPKVC